MSKKRIEDLQKLKVVEIKDIYKRKFKENPKSGLTKSKLIEIILSNKKPTKKPFQKSKYIQDPETMWNHFVNYRDYTKARPFLVKDWVGKNAKEVKRERERPLTMEGFEEYCQDNEIIRDLGDYFSNKGNRYSEYSTICTRILNCIRRDQIEGGMANIYNSSITQRLNGLVDKKEIDSNINANVNNNNIDYTSLSDDTLKDILKNLQKND